MDTFSGEATLTELLCLIYERGSILKENEKKKKKKEFAPIWRKFFQFRKDPSQTGIGI